MSVAELPKDTRATLTVHEGEGHSARSWRWTAGTGIALVVLATAQIVAQHFTVHHRGGLRTYHEVLQYVASPVMFVMQCGFLFAVTVHAMLGIRGIVLDFDLNPRTRRRLDTGLWTLGTLTIIYGLGLLTTLAIRA